MTIAADQPTGHRRKVTAVLACYNRRPLTLRCLRTLYDQAQDVDLSVVLFDDDSQDGTEQAVRAEFPAVRIIKGDGNAFWGGGMHAAMSAALEDDLDFILWLNDDVDLAPDALRILFAAEADARQREPDALGHIILGAVVAPGTNDITYGGYRRRSRFSPVWLNKIGPIAGELTPCDTMNGNIVLVPEAVARATGPNDPTFIQELGDLDYGYRAVKAGALIWIAPQAAGECSYNPRSDKKTPPGNLMQRWRALNTPHGLPIKSWRPFMWRHGGLLGLVELGTIYAKRLTGF